MGLVGISCKARLQASVESVSDRLHILTIRQQSLETEQTHSNRLRSCQLPAIAMFVSITGCSVFTASLQSKEQFHFSASAEKMP